MWWILPVDISQGAHKGLTGWADQDIKSRLPNGTLMPDPLTFPSGMRELANFIHNVSNCQNSTCKDTSCSDCTCETPGVARNISLCNYSQPAYLQFGVYTDRGVSLRARI